MPDRRALLLSLGVAIGVAVLTIAVWHVPVAIGAGAGILLGGLALTGAVSVRVEGPEADAAWRDAAPDLVDWPAGPPEGVLPEQPAVPAAGPRRHDVPSGD